MAAALRTTTISAQASVPANSQPACVASTVKTPISSPVNPPVLWLIGTVPRVNMIGSAIGAVIRSYGRTHSPADTPTRRKKTPYAVGAPPNSRLSKKAKANRTKVPSRPQPRPVSRGDGNRAAAAASGASGPRRRARTR